ncbi:MAG: sodium-dependent transporter [Eubacterium sp.]|nr:sodium-dependent transporter [Candidatus Colimonas fimequi]
MENEKRSSFSGHFGFVIAAASSAIGLGNLWRFPYLAAKDGGGIFLLFYIILVLTFGYTMLTTEVAIGRKTRQGPLTAYSAIHKNWGALGIIACAIPAIIMPYYCVIGGWVFKYLEVFLTFNGEAAAEDGYFTGHITAQWEPIIWTVLFFAVCAIIIIVGVEKGIEKYSRILMPILLVLIIGISIFSLTLSYTDADGVTRTGIDGLKVYFIPNFDGLGPKDYMITFMDALGQLFFSISVAMGIMVAYGSYAPKEANLGKAINNIEFFDTAAALLAGFMIIPAVVVFMGADNMSAGPGLMFISLPKVFAAMGGAGKVVGLVFFLIVSLAAVTSAVSVMEAVVSSLIDKFKWSRLKSSIIFSVYTIILGVIVCLGYNKLYFEKTLPNGAVAQVLDLMDYLSNNLLMPTIALLTCILIGWVVKPVTIIDEVTQGKYKFSRKWLYVAMIKFIAPALLLLMLLQSLGLNIIQ